jgi:hypothetical protein
MTTLETTYPAEETLREIDAAITVQPTPDGGYADLWYSPPEFAAYNQANPNSPRLDGFPLLCENNNASILAAKLQIAKTVAFLREAGVEAYLARVNVSTHP